MQDNARDLISNDCWERDKKKIKKKYKHNPKKMVNSLVGAARRQLGINRPNFDSSDSESSDDDLDLLQELEDLLERVDELRRRIKKGKRNRRHSK